MEIYYKYCIVPLCKSTTIKTPNKIFIRLPYDSRRSKWLKACRRNEKDIISQNSALHVCEDHFNLEEDMDNYIKYKLMGGKKKMKPSAVPHIFHCQPDRKRTFTQSPRSAALKRIKRTIIDDAIASTSTSSSDIYGCAESLTTAVEKRDVATQSHCKFRSEKDDVPTDDTEEQILNVDDEEEYELDEKFEFENHRPETTNTRAYETVVTKPVEHIVRPPKRRRLIPRAGNVTKFEIAKCMKQASDVIKTISHHPPQHPEQPDECSLYAQLLATKLRAMDKRTRTIVTNKIDNLVFNAEMCSLDSLPITSFETFSENSRQYSHINDYSQTSVEIDVKSPSIMESSLHNSHSTA